MNRSGTLLKRSKPAYEDTEDEDDQMSDEAYAIQKSPKLIKTKKTFFRAYQVEKKGAVVVVEPKDMTPINKVGLKMQGGATMQKLFYVAYVSQGMDHSFEPWKWTNKTFKRFYKEMSLRYTSNEQIADELIEIICSSGKKEKPGSTKKGIYDQEDFDKVLELSLV